MNIAIIGCGYIGSCLSEYFFKQGHHVTTTTRSSKRLKKLKELSQNSIIMHGKDETELDLLIRENDVIIVTVAADNPDDYEETYLATAKAIRHVASANNTPKTLIYTSSTSVYGNHQGRWVDEQADLLSQTDQAEILIEAEKTFLSLNEFGWNVCIFRLTEIYGPGRDCTSRIKDFEGNKLPGTGENHTNMIHRDDIVGAITYSLNHHLEGIFNLTDDDHPKRMEFYDAIAKENNLPKVEWDPSLSTIHKGNKRISNHKLKAAGYIFAKPHREVTGIDNPGAQ